MHTRRWQRLDVVDLLLAGLAVHKLARVLAHRSTVRPVKVAPWLGGGYLVGMLAAPGPTRALTAALAVDGAADLIQFGDERSGD